MIAARCDKKNKSLEKLSGQLVFLNVALMALERQQGGHPLWKQIHRSVQTIRATCAHTGLADLERLACDLEDLVRLIRDEVVEQSSKLLGLVRRCAEMFECGVDSARIGVPMSYEFEEVSFDLHQILIDISLEVSSC